MPPRLGPLLEVLAGFAALIKLKKWGSTWLTFRIDNWAEPVVVADAAASFKTYHRFQATSSLPLGSLWTFKMTNYPCFTALLFKAVTSAVATLLQLAHVKFCHCHSASIVEPAVTFSFASSSYAQTRISSGKRIAQLMATFQHRRVEY